MPALCTFEAGWRLLLLVFPRGTVADVSSVIRGLACPAERSTLLSEYWQFLRSHESLSLSFLPQALSVSGEIIFSSQKFGIARPVVGVWRVADACRTTDVGQESRPSALASARRRRPNASGGELSLSAGRASSST